MSTQATPTLYDDDLEPEPVLGDEIAVEPEDEELTPAFITTLVEKCIQFTEALVGHALHPYQQPLARRIIESVIMNDAEEVTALAARQCLDGDTVIFRRDGTAVRLREHEDAWSTGVKPTKRYKTHGGGEIIATDNHPVMTDRGWVPAGDLRIGDSVVTLAEWDIWGSLDASVEQAQLLGYMTTDGSWRRDQSPKFTNTRSAYLDEVEGLTEELFGITPKRYAKGNGYDQLMTLPRHGQRQNPVKAWLLDQEFDHGFPTTVFSWPKASVAAFVNRAWSGDGCVRTKGASAPDVFLACGNDEVYARYWQSLLLKFGVTSTVKREVMARGTGTFHRLVVGSGGDNVRRFFSAFGETFGKEVGSRAALDSCAVVARAVDHRGGCVHDLKRHLFSEGRRTGPGGIKGSPTTQCVKCGADNPRTVRARGRRSAVDRTLVGDGLPTPDGEVLSYRRVISIEDAGEREVFDVEYAGKGWFVAQGVYVSNSGKTEVISDVVAGLVIVLPRLAKIYPDLLGQFKDGFWVGMFAPVEGQVETMFQRTVAHLTSEHAKDLMTDPEIDDSAKRQGGAVKTIKLVKSGSFISMMTANPRAKIESRTFHLAVLDEAQDADDYVVSKSIAPMLAYNSGTMVKTGTPSTHKGNFYHSVMSNKRKANGARKTLRRVNHFQWDWRDVAKVNPNYGRFIKKEMARIGEDSDEFQMSYAVRWILDRGMFTSQRTMDRLGDTSMKILKDWTKTPVVVGIDPARKTDSTVVTVVWVDWERPDEFGYFDHRVLNWLELQGDDWEVQYAKIIDFLSHYNILSVAVDANGVGDAVAQRLRIMLPRAEVHSVTSSQAEQSKRFKHLLALMERDKVGWPAHAETRRLRIWNKFTQQMLDAEKVYKGQYFTVRAPAEAWAHDDFCDSLSLAVALTSDLQMSEVEVSSNPFF